MKHAMNDVLVLVPGIMGSSLYRDGRAIWDASLGAFTRALTTHYRALRELRLPAGIGDEAADDGVTPAALIADVRLPLGLWTFDLGYTRLVRFLKEAFELQSDPAQGPLNLIQFPYDWRLSNRYNGAKLRMVCESALSRWVEGHPERRDAKLVFICHSMGGLVARWYVERLGGSAQTRAIITLGTPHRGALGALDTLANGVRKGPARFREALTEFGRSLPSLYQLLPEYACIEQGDTLCKTTEISIPELEAARVRDAMSFYAELQAARELNQHRYALHPIGGHKQRTLTTARIEEAGLACSHEIEAQDERGDGTVPRLSFTPRDLSPAAAGAHYVADNHAGLVHNQAVFDHIEGVLTAKPIVHFAASTPIAVDMPEVLEAGETLTVRALDPPELPLEVLVDDGVSARPPQRLLASEGDVQATLRLPGPGVYRVVVRGVPPSGVQVQPITTVVTVWPTEVL